jgi:hypothetical protein
MSSETFEVGDLLVSDNMVYSWKCDYQVVWIRESDLVLVLEKQDAVFKVLFKAGTVKIIESSIIECFSRST